MQAPVIVPDKLERLQRNTLWDAADGSMAWDVVPLALMWVIWNGRIGEHWKGSKMALYN